ncbi:MAG: hypothetical protein Q7T59_03885, partial [Candidatus Woesebacteria bacterium]|nr:hypothetical protein [Candidatus Woesebacteria bacterium]
GQLLDGLVITNGGHIFLLLANGGIKRIERIDANRTMVAVNRLVVPGIVVVRLRLLPVALA